MSLLILSFTSFLLSLLTVALIRQHFHQPLLDIPNERSSHNQPTPRGGGIGFIIAFAMTTMIAFFSINPSPSLLSLWLILTPLTIIGIVDDYRGVSASIRYVIHLLAAAIAVAVFGSFPLPLPENWGIMAQIISITLTIIGMTAIINFYNFMDGLDGLLAGCTAVQLGFLALYLQQPSLWLLVAALLGFLWWNWFPAKIFMGDAGSTVLGATVAIALLNSQSISQGWSAFAITLPLIGDAIYTLFRRLLNRENIFQPHRSHLYQRLQQANFSHAQVAIMYISINLLVAISINFGGEKGGWISLLEVICALIIGEIYLKSRRENLELEKKYE